MFQHAHQTLLENAAQLARKPSGRAAAFVTVAALHGLLLLAFLESNRPPTTRGDGTSAQVAMVVALVPASALENPSGQGQDVQTRTFSPDQSQEPQSDRSTAADGAGFQPEMISGGAHSASNAPVGPSDSEGAGGGTKDDPWARVSLKPAAAPAEVFDLAARNDALFLTKVRRCIGDDLRLLANVMIATTLDQDGKVVAARPIREGPEGKSETSPTASETKAINAVRACQPYHDLVLGRTPVLKIPQAGAASAPSPSS